MQMSIVCSTLTERLCECKCIASRCSGHNNKDVTKDSQLGFFTPIYSCLLPAGILARPGTPVLYLQGVSPAVRCQNLLRQILSGLFR